MTTVFTTVFHLFYKQLSNLYSTLISETWGRTSCKLLWQNQGNEEYTEYLVMNKVINSFMQWTCNVCESNWLCCFQREINNKLCMPQDRSKVLTISKERINYSSTVWLLIDTHSSFKKFMELVGIFCSNCCTRQIMNKEIHIDILR